MARLFSEAESEALATALGIESLARRDQLWRAEPRLRLADPKAKGRRSHASLSTPSLAASGSALRDNPSRVLTLLVMAFGLMVVLLMLMMVIVRSEPEHGAVRIVELPTLQTPKLELAAAEADSAEAAKVAPASAQSGQEATRAEQESGSEVAQQPTAAKATARPLNKPRPQRASSPDPAALTRALRRLQPAIERCFAAHALSLSGSPKINLEFSIDAQGKLLRTALHPDAMGETALGRCVLNLAQQASFPAQGAPVTFKIQVTARRVR